MNSWVLRGKIMKGHQRGGSMLGFPTANIQLDDACIGQLQKFLNSVWCGFAMIEDENVPGEDVSGLATRVAAVQQPDGTWAFVSYQDKDSSSSTPRFVYPTVLSVGTNPHFRDVALTVEPHIMHKFARDFYGRHLRIVAVEKLRDMGAFTTLDALIAQIKDDCSVGSRLLERDASQRFRLALVDHKVWGGGAGDSGAGLPGAVPDKSFFRMLQKEGDEGIKKGGDEKQAGASQL